ncbi:hypothetical protein EGR_07067 [Echinococcus granulosus]|uniref:Uncharacterized protein n=1 Tax=Echinococcus granulosus TaxID=6210 RepID=W6UIU0_ECHGR|nr:hypothetical protein EGR_07067 [Echinococcus granulosus]EUB58047.1 hypothetical protein EGR_07067 [Echinococcus granulosus]
MGQLDTTVISSSNETMIDAPCPIGAVREVFGCCISGQRKAIPTLKGNRPDFYRWMIGLSRAEVHLTQMGESVMTSTPVGLRLAMDMRDGHHIPPSPMQDETADPEESPKGISDVVKAILLSACGYSSEADVTM